MEMKIRLATFLMNVQQTNGRRITFQILQKKNIKFKNQNQNSCVNAKQKYTNCII